MTPELIEVLLSWKMAVAAFAVVIAGLMRGYAGFGTAILLAPIFSVLWGPRAGIPILLFIEMLVSIQLVPKTWRQANHRVIFPIGLAACIATPFGAYILLTADAEVLKRVAMCTPEGLVLHRAKLVEALKTDADATPEAGDLIAGLAQHGTEGAAAPGPARQALMEFDQRHPQVRRDAQS